MIFSIYKWDSTTVLTALCIVGEWLLFLKHNTNIIKIVELSEEYIPIL